MKLKDIVIYRNQLEEITSGDENIKEELFKNLNKFNTTLNLSNTQIDNLKPSMFEKQTNILKNLYGLYNDLNSFKDSLESMITDIETSYYKKSQEVYIKDMKKSIQLKEIEYKHYHLFGGKGLSVEEGHESKEKFLGTMLKYVSFEWPGLEIGPVNGELTNQLVSLDPLYLADNNNNEFTTVKKQFNQLYQKRLRYYTFDDSLEEPLHELPQQQFGLIVAVDWFNFKPQQITERYLKNAFDILRPGGVIVFTYNNCNYPKAIDKVDEMYYTYTNGNTLKQFCKSIGYEIISSYDGEKEIGWCASWLELQKPGELTSLRGGQNLGAINRL